MIRKISIKTLGFFLVIDIVFWYIIRLAYLKVLFGAFDDIYTGIASKPPTLNLRNPTTQYRIASFERWLFAKDCLAYVGLALITIAICKYYRKYYREALFAYILHIIIFLIWTYLLKVPALW